MKKIIGVAFVMLFLAVGTSWGITADEYCRAGTRFLSQKNYETALGYFKAAIRLDEKSWRAYEGMGFCYYHSGENGEALSAFENSLRVHPDNPFLNHFTMSLKDNEAVSQIEDPSLFAPVPLRENGDPASGAGSRPEVISQPSILRFSFISNEKRKARDFGLKFYGGYNHSQMDDLATALRFWQSDFQASGYAVTPSLDNSGLVLGTELVYSLDEENSISISLDGVNSGNYRLHADNGTDQIDQDITPYLLAVSLNYYRYFSSKNNRFYIGAGLGYAQALVHYEGPMDPSGLDESVDLLGGDLEGSIQIGEEFILVDSLVLELSIKGRYANISKVEGTVDSRPVALEQLPVGNAILVDKGFGADNGYRDTSIDFTGPDVKFSLNVYY